VSQKATKHLAQSRKGSATTSSQSALGNGAQAKASSFQPYVPLASTSNKRKREDYGQERQEVFRDFMDAMQASGSKPTWSNGTDPAATKLTESSHSPQAVGIPDSADGSLKKLKKKDKKARNDQFPESGLAARDDTTPNRRENIRKESELVQDTIVPGVSRSKKATNVTEEDVAQSREEATEKKKKKRKAPAADNDGHEAETRIEHEPSGSKIENKKKLKSSKDAKGGVDFLDDASGLDEDDADRTQLADMKNDNDWLRERTNRVLDLIDNDEGRIPKSAPEVSGHSGSSSSGPEHQAEPQMPASSVVEHNVERSLANGRLFIRNLPYSAGEVDIQTLFSRYGKVTEVSH
jgi:hypothetical protein